MKAQLCPLSAALKVDPIYNYMMEQNKINIWIKETQKLFYKSLLHQTVVKTTKTYLTLLSEVYESSFSSSIKNTKWR